MTHSRALLIALPQNKKLFTEQFQKRFNLLDISYASTYKAYQNILSKKSFDLLILDEDFIDLEPDFDKLKTGGISTSVMVICEEKNDTLWEKLVPETIVEYFVKPLNIEKLSRFLNMYLAQSRRSKYLQISQNYHGNQDDQINREAIFQTFFEDSNDAIMLVDEKGAIIAWNKHGELLTGHKAKDIIGKPLWEFYSTIIPPDNRSHESMDKLKSGILKSLGTGIPFWPSGKVERKIRRADGAIKTVEQSIKLIKTPKGYYLSSVSSDITELVTEREKSAELLSLLTDSQHVAKIGSLYYHIEDDRWVCTEALEDILELPQDYSSQIKNWITRIHPSHQSMFLNFMDHLVDDDEMLFELKYKMIRHHDRAMIWVKHTGKFERDKSGKIISFTSTVQDITVPKLQSESLKRSEERLKASQQLARLGTFEADPLSNRLTANSIFAEIVGVDISLPMTYSNWLNIIHSKDRKRITKKIKHKSHQRMTHANEDFRIIREDDGGIRWVNGMMEFRYSEAGKLVKISGTIQDVTRQRESETDLRNLSFALQQSPASIVITDLEGNIEYVNAKFMEVTGYSLNEILGENPRVLSSGEKTREDYEILWKTILGGSVWQGEFHNKRKNGELYWEWAVISPIRDEDGRITQLLAVKEDITQRKLDAEKQQFMQEQLNRAQRMEAIGTLAGGIAHDFNNILQSMYLYLGMAHDALPDGYIKDDIAQVTKAANRAKELVGQILTYSRRGEIKKSDVLVQYVVKEALKFLKSTFPLSVKFYEEINMECLPVYCDPTHIHQIFMNIGINAYDALPEKSGTIKISLNMVEIDAKQSEVLLVAPGNYVEMTISDTGRGIQPSVMPLIFNPFFSTKEPGTGNGLGLSVVQGIVEELGGQIYAESDPGVDTTFRVLFPAVGKHDVELLDLSNITLDFEKLSILVGDSEPDVREGTRRTLENLGCHVVSCKTAQDVLDMLANYPDTFRLVIADQNLSEMSGVHLAKQVKQEYPETAFILMSSRYSKDTNEEDPSGYVDSLLKKPWQTVDLLNSMASVITDRKGVGSLQSKDRDKQQ